MELLEGRYNFILEVFSVCKEFRNGSKGRESKLYVQGAGKMLIDVGKKKVKGRGFRGNKKMPLVERKIHLFIFIEWLLCKVTMLDAE